MNFYTALRQRGTPEEFGFPAGARRRTQGLRREEVAQLAGISATWYTWIEQGREVNVSAEALRRLSNSTKTQPNQNAPIYSIWPIDATHKRIITKPTPRQKP
ncbi:MAG: helix-turn-helix transcriptional regulator [Methylotenera sp.]